MLVHCENFFAKSGWHCQPLEGNANMSRALYVSTPLLLSNRKPLDFYIQEIGDLISIYDDGTTLFALSNNGFDFTNRRNWKSLHALAEKFDFELDETGEFKSTKPESEFMVLCADAIALFSAIRTWEKERSSEQDADFSLTHQVEEILLRNSPDRILRFGPKVNVGNAEVVFDFQWGELFVDTLAPVANAVNSRLRKGLLMQRIDSANNVLFVIDDRHIPEKAGMEMAVLGGVAPSMMLSTLRNMQGRYLVPLEP
jgi:hypothetical protein